MEVNRSIKCTDTHFRDFGLGGLNKVGRANLEANIVSTLQAGCFFGSFLAAWVADRFGRKKGLIFAAIVTMIGCVMQAAASGHVPVMYVGR